MASTISTLSHCGLITQDGAVKYSSPIRSVVVQLQAGSTVKAENCYGKGDPMAISTAPLVQTKKDGELGQGSDSVHT